MSELNKALGEFYTEHVKCGKPHFIAARPLIQALVSDPEVMKEARQKLADLNSLNAKCNGNLERRCYVSHIHRIALQEVFNGG